MKNLRSAQLWLQYMDMIEILRNFIRSECIGDWTIHLKTLCDMLPYLAAAGHNSYNKSIYVYLQRLAKLPVQQPVVQRHFVEGRHVVRRSERYWAGLSSDLVTEQVLMRTIKSAGGLTRGRGMGEQQRHVWLLSTPACAEVNEVLQEYTSVSYCTSDQHKDISPAHQERDTRDIRKVLEYLQSKTPFDANDSRLHSIDTGVIASCSVDADKGSQVGKKIVNVLVGQKVQEYVFKKEDQAVTLEAKDAVHTGTETGLLILSFCSSVSFQQGHLRESCWTKFSLMNLVAIHPHFLKRQFFYFLQTKLHSPMPCGNKFQICLAQQHLHSTFWMEVSFSTEFCGLVVKHLMLCRYVQYVTDKYRSPVVVLARWLSKRTVHKRQHSQ